MFTASLFWVNKHDSVGMRTEKPGESHRRSDLQAYMYLRLTGVMFTYKLSSSSIVSYLFSISVLSVRSQCGLRCHAVMSSDTYSRCEL